MGYDHYFHFIKDDLIDPTIAFIQNVDNFLFCIYCDYLERYQSDIKKERNRLLADLFRIIKTPLMGGVKMGMKLGREKINIKEALKEILEEKDEEKRDEKLSNLKIDLKMSLMFLNVLDELIDLKFSHLEMNYAEMQVDLILYCILVNGLSKTKGEKFDMIKVAMEPLTKILNEIFCEFDKNEFLKERTFIFPLRSPGGTHDEFYIINYNDDLLRKYENEDRDIESDKNDIKIMFLSTATNKDKEDKRRFTYYSIVLDEALCGSKKEYKL